MRIAILTTDNRSACQQFGLKNPWFGPAPEALLQGFALMPEKLEVHVISCTRRPVNAPEKLADNIWFHSLHVPKIGWMRTGYIGCINAVRRKLRQIQPDLVHGQGTELESGICAAYSGFPNVITLLGIMKEMAKTLDCRPGSFHWFASILETIALRRTTGVFCNSRYTSGKVLRRTKNTWLVPNAIRSQFFLTPLPSRCSVECNLLNVGTICSYKRQNELLDVLDSLHRKRRLSFKMEFIGNYSPADPYARRFITRLNSCPFASILKFRSVPELIQKYDSADALIHVSEIETFCLVAAEALSRNLKLFGFGVGGLLDIAKEMEGAALVADDNWFQLYEELATWISHGHIRPRNAHQIVEKRYSPITIAEQHLNIYAELGAVAARIA